LTSWRSRNVSSDANSSSEINSLNDSIDEWFEYTMEPKPFS